MDCIYGALKQLNIAIPQANTYPAALQTFMQRDYYESTLGDLLAKLEMGVSDAIFAKPADRQKMFTGQLFANTHDFYFLHGISKKQKIYCSDKVNFISEHRVYVVNSEIRAIDCYAGDKNIRISETTVSDAINKLDQASESYAGYAIDFGVLDSAETALIEMNDGFAIGAYQIDAGNYTDMLLARWQELLETANGRA